VFVCKHTTTIHPCGIDHCKEKVELDDGQYCSLRGAFLAQAMSLARSGKDIDIRVCGDSSYKHGNYSFDVSDTLSHVEDEDEVYDDEDEHVAEDVEDPENKVVADVSYFYNLFRSNVRDVDYVLWAYPHASVDVMKLKIADRREWRKHAEHAWAVCAHDEAYVRVLEANAMEATRKWLEAVRQYVQRCANKGLRVDHYHVVRMWMRDVKNKYEGIYFGGDVVAMNNANKVYFIESMLNIWERFTSVPAVVKGDIRFSDCCTAILAALRDGMRISVRMIDGDEKPYPASKVLTRRQLRKSRLVEVWIINKHSDLHLVTSSVVREVQNDVNQRKRSQRDTTMLVGDWYTGKRLPGHKKQKTFNESRSNTLKSSRIPPLKCLHETITEVLRYGKTLDELYSFCLDDVNHRAFQQPGRRPVL
jgi:hypothetical protein